MVAEWNFYRLSEFRIPIVINLDHLATADLFFHDE